MKVQDCMTKSTISVKPSENIYQVAKIMGDNHIGCVPVCDNLGKVVGILTDRDILLRGVACNKDANTTPISDIMTTKVIKTTPDTDVESVTETMSRNQIRRMPVIENDQIVGILTIGDIARTKCISKEELGTTMEYICGWNKKNDK